MKAIGMREFMRKPSILSGLQPGDAVKLEGRVPLIVSRPKEKQVTAQEMGDALDKLAAKCPPIDTQEVLEDLRK